MTVTVADWGATLLSAEVPLADGSLRRPLLGCAKLEDYARQAAFLGASVGRYANRIGHSRFPLDGQVVNVTPSNDAGHQLHGGPEGFDKRRWRIVRADEQEVLFALTSPDGDQGFPGTLQATAHYRLTDDNRIAITYRATVDQPCPVNMTNHVYFNLDGEQSDVRQHQLQILAQRYLPVESDGIPDGELKDVANTSFDFRQPKTIAADFLADADQQKVKGYDHAFLLDAKGDASQPAAQVWSQDGKLQMTVYTSAPALQFYSGNYLGGTPSQTTEPYADWQGLALESEFLPGFAEPSAMAAAGLCITSGPGVCQPDGISVYRPIIASALHQGALLFVPALLSAASFFSNLLYFPSPKDKKITCVLQAPYTAPLFSLWLGISIAVRQITAI
ncbi:aldose 1-epimerase [Klebsiella pneumoniae]|uniref:Aldose 1-epimerase n=2 Tax=Klebsiella pneumoniae TaxID=573 RepID=A0A377WHQ9_KLEPN|nr:aldose 1-epimerase [Klebsiella pneumoniae]